MRKLYEGKCVLVRVAMTYVAHISVDMMRGACACVQDVTRSLDASSVDAATT